MSSGDLVATLRRHPVAALSLCLVAGGLGWALTPAAIGDDTLSVDEQLRFAGLAADWVRAERDAHRPRGVPLTAAERAMFAPFFSGEVLDAVRVVPVDTMPTAHFFDELSRRGFSVVDLGRASGVTVDDTLLIHTGRVPSYDSPRRRSILFHELVHVVQYRQLGVEPMMRHYFRSLVETGFSYRDIVFEHQAFALQARYDRASEAPFSVEGEVASMVAALDRSEVDP